MNLTATQYSPAHQRRWHDVAYWLLLVVACAVFLMMNVLTTFKEDDMAFSLVEGQWTPIRSLMDVLRSHANLFVDANGRTANLVAALFCGLLGKSVFNVCNMLVFGLLAHLLSLLATGRRSLLALAMFLVAVGTCYPVPGETMLWLDGSCNYMWAITLSLALVYGLQHAPNGPLGWGRGLLLLVVSIIAGSFNEATSFGFLLGLVAWLALNSNVRHRRAAVITAGYLLGIAIIVASPGAWHRAATGDISINMGMADLLHSRLYIFSEKMMRFYLPVAAAIVGLTALALKRGKAVRQSVWTYIFLGLALVMLVLGQTSERAYAPLCTVALLILVMAADRVLRHWTWGRAAAIVVCLGLAGFTAARGLVELKRYKAFNDQAMSEITAAPDQAVLHQRLYDGYSRFIKPMNFISTSFFAHEDIYRAYFGKKNVQFVSDSVYVRYHEGRLLDGAKVTAPHTTHPDLIGQLYTIPGQDYIAIEFNGRDLPGSFQTAEYYNVGLRDGADSETDEIERQRRRNYGITIDYDPVGFFPLEYQGKCYLICKAPEASVRRIVFPLWLTPGGEVQAIEVNL